MGGASKPPSMPMNPDMLAMALFGRSYDQLTYTQKSAIDDMLVTKKAEGGIMDLGGNEMDLRAKGGFVPIGKKKKQMMFQQDFLKMNLYLQQMQLEVLEKEMLKKVQRKCIN
jgi:hypothetical protein